MTSSLEKIIIYQLYLLQLENYDRRRFWHILWRQGWRAREMRQPLAWTMKMKSVAAVSGLLYLIAVLFVVYVSIFFAVSSLTLFIITIIAILAGWRVFGIWACGAVILLEPFDYALKRRLIKLARQKLRECPKLKIIGITGSYGKTTMKETVAALLSQHYKILKTEANKNTPLGIARIILSDLTPETEIFIVEMGAYRRGDIKNLCDIACPHISILTGINESHLERFGSMENTIAAKFEIIAGARQDAVILLNADDELVSKHYQDYVGNREVIFYSAYNDKRCDYRVIDRRFIPESLVQCADIMHKTDSVGAVKTPLLGEYIFGDIIAAIIIARQLKISTEEIRHGIASLQPILHRLQPIRGQNDILVIDDSYNGSAHGVEEAIRVLERFKNRRILFVTPGLVETGERARALHQRIGRRLAGVANLVVLIQNSVTSYIEQGLLAGGFAKDNILYFKTATEAHEEIQKLTKPGDVVLFQNDWPDNYI
jgi:UDP-N-acetylmuramoyl-tripeptide--D-alanyl-D-alanine ligase